MPGIDDIASPGGDAERTRRLEAALLCLEFVLRHHGLDYGVNYLRHEYASEAPIDAARLVAFARQFGVQASRQEIADGDVGVLRDVLPVVLILDDGSFTVLIGFRGEGEEREVGLLDPTQNANEALLVTGQELAARWSGEALLFKRPFSAFRADSGFNFAWFLSYLRAERSAFVDVTVGAMIIHALALATPIFFQIIIDKVLVHQNFSTLYVLSAGVVLAIAFDSVIDFIRQYVLLNATTKIDVRIARATFSHLLSLPVQFFERSSAGVVTKHMQQTEIVRQFLTGQLFLTLLDALVIVVFLPVLMFYSLALSGIVILFSTTIAGVIYFLIGPFRRRLHELYMAEGERQAILVETIGGMQTVKGLAIEPRQRRRWDSIAANAVARNFDVGKISLIARTSSQSLEKLMIVAIVAIGALIVFAGEMSVGELVAFQMLAGRVSNPLVRLVALIHEYQEALLSVRMLGNVMNAAPERSSGRGLRTPIRGEIELSDVTFTYPNTNRPALRDINVRIPAGSVVGIVGRSGSGKSTLAKLLEGIVFAESGVTRVDGVDVREYDLSHLRNHMGVVLQDSFLFRGTVRDNVAATRPDGAFEDIVAACRNAGASEFIEQLPQGYATELEEAAVNLSGGQRQRLAIARALLREPSILILDEATSALDPESEAAVQANLGRIAHQRTTVIISHRLSMVRPADLIIVLDQGLLVGTGRHDALLRSCQLYASLWAQQRRGVVG